MIKMVCCIYVTEAGAHDAHSAADDDDADADAAADDDDDDEVDDDDDDDDAILAFSDLSSLRYWLSTFFNYLEDHGRYLTSQQATELVHIVEPSRNFGNLLLLVWGRVNIHIYTVI